jgi:hypothetical protein
LDGVKVGVEVGARIGTGFVKGFQVLILGDLVGKRVCVDMLEVWGEEEVYVENDSAQNLPPPLGLYTRRAI